MKQICNKFANLVLEAFKFFMNCVFLINVTRHLNVSNKVTQQAKDILLHPTLKRN